MTLYEFLGEICLTDRAALQRSIYKEVKKQRRGRKVDREKEKLKMQKRKG